ncbi:MAG: thiamine ABC transporter substrate-binding protein [Nocardioides sp.]
MKSILASRRALALAVSATLVPLAGCSLAGGESASDSEAASSDTVVLVTHESFNLPKKLQRDFERESGYDLVVRQSGDAGALTTKLVLTADNPTGDVAFGVDNTFASRALDEGVFADADVSLPAGAEEYALDGDGADRMFPIDTGGVCVNVDDTWFADHDLEAPTTLEDLADPAYQDLFVTSSALSSSPGMAFLLSTIAEYGDDWPDYWQRLLDNGTLVVDGWEDAYYGEFTQGGGGGTRPIVLSYDSSPAFTVPKGADESTTSALLDTCFQQVEYAGVLAGADNPEGGRELLDFLLSDEVQAALPASMYVFPVVDDVELPADWATYAPQSTSPHEVDPAEIAANRDAWLEEWRDLVTQ